MSSIPYNYGSYIDAKVAMTDTGHVSAGKQIQSPASAGSRGLAKTTQFTNDRTQMQMGNSPIAESMVEIRSILNRIDGVNAPVQEDAGEDEKVVDMLRNIKQHLDNHPNMNEHPSLVALDQLADDLESGDKPADYESAVQEDAGDEQKWMNYAKFWKFVNEIFKDKAEEDISDQFISATTVDEEPSYTTSKELMQRQLKKQNTPFKINIDDDLSEFSNELNGRYEDETDMAKMKQAAIEIIKTGSTQIEPVKNAGTLSTYVQEDDGELARLKELSGMEAPKESEKAVSEDIGDKGRIALEKAGFDPMKVKEYMAVFNDHGDTSDIDQMNMDKVGLADAMAMVLASHDVENESYQPMPEGDEFDIEEDEDFEEVLGPLGFPEDETELFDAEYQGRKVPLNKPMRGDSKKFKVYVKDPKTGNVKKVNFGHGGTSAKRKTMRIRKSNPKARKSFRARHNCANPGPKTKARYWSCRKW